MLDARGIDRGIVKACLGAELFEIENDDVGVISLFQGAGFPKKRGALYDRTCDKPTSRISQH
jgi:hypothetical protein